jgi:Putative transmembrane protein (PGPGW)
VGTLSPQSDMGWLESLRESLSAQSGLWWWVFAALIAVFAASPLVAAWLVVRLPRDYFAATKRRQSGWRSRNPMLSLVIGVGRNLLGAVLLIAGLVMLLTPGQGLLSIAVGLALLDFPGKYRLERWLVTRRPVWRSINWLRKRAGRDELKKPR